MSHAPEARLAGCGDAMVSGLPSAFPGGGEGSAIRGASICFISCMLLCMVVWPQPFTDEEPGFGRVKAAGTGHTAALEVGSAVSRLCTATLRLVSGKLRGINPIVGDWRSREGRASPGCTDPQSFCPAQRSRGSRCRVMVIHVSALLSQGWPSPPSLSLIPLQGLSSG